MKDIGVQESVLPPSYFIHVETSLQTMEWEDLPSITDQLQSCKPITLGSHYCGLGMHAKSYAF